MSTGTDFLANLQKKTVKNTVQQKQQKRVNASAVDVSALLEAALGKKKPVEAVADVRQSTDAATASFLPLADTHQGRSTQQKPKNASDKKQTPQKSKDIVDAGITALIQKALDAKKVMAEPDIAERLQSSMESEFTKLFTPEEPQDNKFVSTATFRATKKKAGTLNVAAYIRVSTDMSDQENSYETQEKYFNQLIENNPAWNAVGVYSDYGISGTSKEKRTGFRRLMRHCKDGKIDRIVCKSISRFARNTADFMSALDVLHDCGVTILFEKENLDTADPTSDFILTTLAAIAQEESRSISSNIRLGQKMRFPKGDVPNKIMYGYRYNGKMVTSESGYEYKDIEIVEEEARVVRRIFHEVVEGKAYTEIATADEIVAAGAMKLYLQSMEPAEALRKVRAVYEPKVIMLDSGEGVPVQSNIDGAKYAAFIDESVVFAAQKMRGRGDALAEMVMEKLKAVDGKCLIKCASVEFMSFIEDVYRSLRRREY